MLRVAGCEPHPLNRPDDWPAFRNFYAQYLDENLDPTPMIEFRKAIAELQKHVIKLASVVVCTVNGAGEPKLYRNFKPAIVFIDEAAMVAEPDAIIPLARYLHAPLIMLGDHRQLKPTILSEGEPAGHFARQMLVPLFDRLIRLGHPSVMLTEQHRMSPPIASIGSTLFYEGKLTNARSTELEYRPSSSKMLTFMHKTYMHPHPVIMLDLKGQTARVGNSRCNRVNASLTMNLVSTLLNTFDPTDLAIISPYRAQQDLYRRALQRMQRSLPHKDLHNIQNKTIDSFQGIEAVITIVDLVVTDHLGFVRQMNRLNVAVTRARDGLIVITDVAANEKVGTHGAARWIARLISHFKANRLRQQVVIASENPYVPDIAEIASADVHEQEVDGNDGVDVPGGEANGGQPSAASSSDAGGADISSNPAVDAAPWDPSSSSRTTASHVGW